ncbi:Protease HtpX [Symmachiella dynata]|uniref:Protease HtpX n=1 Tax=Symmachiella dynata TaxID=2527995 RepID=A0A517ZHC9_9PLAN|nr:M56 family metallopeptidase [Symmachiella dynata]QDU41871.1 Protease HtpX [Symmachiella dynata]
MLQTLFEIVLANAVLATVLAIGVALFARLCRRPAIAHGLWLLVFLKLITPPLVTVPLEILPAPPVISTSSAVIHAPVETTVAVQEAPIPTAIVATNAAPQLTAAPQPAGFPWRNYLVEGIVGLWIAGACGWLLLLGIRAWRFHRMARRTALAPAALQQQVRRLSTAFGVQAVPEVRMIHAQVSPLLWRIGGRPVILLPAELLTQLTPAQIDGILAHELAHLQRRDHWTRRLVLCVTALYWWHPVLWWSRRGLEQAAEQCCDAAVVARFPDHSRDYAAALLQTIDFLTGARPRLPASATTFGQGRSLKRRFAMILDKGVSPRLSWKMRGVLAAVGLTVLVVSPWVVAEEKATLEKPHPEPRAAVGASEAEFERIYAGGNDVKTDSKTLNQSVYMVACRMLVQDESGREHVIFSPRIILAENQEGTIAVGPIPGRTPKSDPEISQLITMGRAMRHVKVQQLDGDFVAFFARIDDKPEMNKGLLPDDDGVVTREFTHVYTKSLNVVEKVRLGKTFSVPFYDTDDDKKSKRCLEFTVTRIEKAKPKSPEPSVWGFTIPDDASPLGQEIRSALSVVLKKKKSVPAFMATTAIKNLRVTVEQVVDELGDAKNYPLVGPARLRKQQIECTAFFDIERQSNWPVPFTNVENCKEVFYLNWDQLFRVIENPSDKNSPAKSIGDETSSTDADAGTKTPDSTILRGAGVVSDSGLVGEVIFDERVKTP